MLNAGAVIAKFKADISDLKRGISDAKSAVGGMRGAFSNMASGAGQAFSNMRAGLATLERQFRVFNLAVAGGFALLAKSALSSAKEFEQTSIAYTTLLGNAEEAQKVIKSIEEDAKKTPFNLPGLLKYNQLLISAGESADASRQVIKDLGNAVSATGGGDDEMSRLAVNLQQIKALGKATALDVKQFAFAGVNIYKLLSETTGKTVEEVKEMDITYDLLTESLHKAGQEGGMFANAMENQSHSLQGMISNIQDAIGIGLKDILYETGAFDAIKSVVQGFLTLLEEAIPRIIAFFTGIRQGIEQLQAGEFGGILQLIWDALAKVGAWIMENQETVLTFLKGLAIAFGALVVIGGIVALLNLLLNPLTLIALGIAFLYTAWQQNWFGIQEITQSIVDFLVNIFNYLRAFWEEWGAYITGFFQGAWQVISNIFNLAVTLILGIIKFFFALFTGNFKEAFEIAKATASGAWEAIKGIFNGAVEMVKNAMGAIFHAIVGKLEDAWNKAKEIAGKIRDAIAGAFDADKRNSPSIRDRLNEIRDITEATLDGIRVPNFSSDIASAIGLATQPASQAMSGGSKVVNQTIYAELHDGLDVDVLSERLAFNYRNSI